MCLVRTYEKISREFVGGERGRGRVAGIWQQAMKAAVATSEPRGAPVALHKVFDMWDVVPGRSSNAPGRGRGK